MCEAQARRYGSAPQISQLVEPPLRAAGAGLKPGATSRVPQIECCMICGALHSMLRMVCAPLRLSPTLKLVAESLAKLLTCRLACGRIQRFKAGRKDTQGTT